MVKKILLFSILLLITILPNIDVNAVSFSTNGYTCVNFLNGTQYCSNVRQFDYDNIPYFGPDFSYTPDNLEDVSYSVVDFRNQSFCPDNSSGGLLNFRFYHNYPFTNSVLNFIEATVNSKNYLCSTTLSQDGRYTEVSCPIGSGFSNQTLTFSYKINDLNFNFPFTAGFSNLIGETCNISTSDIINNNNQNTQDIINNNNSTTQNIINNNTNNTNQIIQNNEQNTQDIIDNQNSNTDKEIASQQVCNSYDKNSMELFNKYLQLDGNEKSSTSNNYGISKYFSINSNSSIKVLSSYPEHDGACFYNVNRSLISCVDLASYQVGSLIPIPSNSSYFRFTIHVRANVPRLEICSNGNQALNDSVNDLNDTLNSEDTPNTSQDIQDMDDMVASDTPISDLITMPLTLINAYINGMNATCSPVNLGNLYGTNLIIPCIDIPSKIGSDLWGKIDVICCIFMCYEIAMLFITAFDGITSLRDDFEGLYQPRHSDVGYQPKHGGGN